MFMLAHERVFGFGLAAAAVMICGTSRWMVGAGPALPAEVTFSKHIEAGPRLTVPRYQAQGPRPPSGDN